MRVATAKGLERWRKTGGELDAQGATLPGVKLERFQLFGAKFDEADLEEASFAAMELIRISFAGANLRRAKFSKTAMADVDFAGAKLKGAKLEEAMFNLTDFSDADLEKANLRRSRSVGAHFNRANLAGADFSGAKAAKADFSGSVLDDEALLYLASQGAKFDDEQQARLAALEQDEILAAIPAPTARKPSGGL